MSDQQLQEETPEARNLPWFNKLVISEEFYKDNFPYDMGKINSLFGSFHPTYKITGFLFGYDDDNLLCCYCFFTPDGVVMEKFNKGIAEKFPNLLRFAMKKAIRRHVMLNSHMKGRFKLHIGYTNDDFVNDIMRFQFKYNF